ncbi:MAG TPA: late competence development ComFB family protein [Gemmatimonadaceae bacterium]|nr:late competence development ComFB family protein [Gemmatimonadaceae bacterium]
MPMQNLLEEAVVETFKQLRAAEPGFCHCAQCHDDVVAHVLNKARPRYTSGSTLGAAVTRVSLAQQQARAEIAVLVLEAMRRVQRNPRHGPEGFVYPVQGGWRARG